MQPPFIILISLLLILRPISTHARRFPFLRDDVLRAHHVARNETLGTEPIANLTLLCSYHRSSVVFASIMQNAPWNEFYAGITSAIRKVQADPVGQGLPLFANYSVACDMRPFDDEREVQFSVLTELYGSMPVSGAPPSRDDSPLALVGPILGSRAARDVAAISSHSGVNFLTTQADPEFDNTREDYPFLTRFQPSDARMARAMFILVKHYGWRNLGAIVADDDSAKSTLTSFLAEAVDSDISVTSVASLNSDASNAPFALERLRDSGVRIILLLSSPAEQYAVLREALALGMLGPPFLYVTSSSIVYDVEIFSDPELAAGLYGTLGVAPMIYDPDTAGPILTEFVAALDAPLPNDTALAELVLSPIWGALAVGAHMATLSALHAVHTLLEERIACVRNASDPVCAVLAADGDDDDASLRRILHSQTVPGPFGPVSMDASGDLAAGVAVVQVTDDPAERYAVRGQVLMDAGLFAGLITEWPGGQTVVPSDSVSVNVEVVTVSHSVAAVGTVLSSIGFLCGIGASLFQLMFRNWSLVKLSSPAFNMLIILGCMLMQAVIPLLAYGLSDDVCQAIFWLMTVSFALVFMALFSKTWRVHRIFNQKKLRVVKIRNKKLYVMTACGTAVFVMMLLAWNLLYPFKRHLHVHQDEAQALSADFGELTVHASEHCSVANHTTFLMIFFGLREILLLFACWIAYEVRNVGIKALNESKWIGYSIYTAFSVDLLMIPALVSWVGGVSSDTVDRNYVYIALGLWLQSMAVLGLLFLPKVLAIALGKEEEWTLNKTTDAASEVTPRASAGNRHRRVRAQRPSPKVGKDELRVQLVVRNQSSDASSLALSDVGTPVARSTAGKQALSRNPQASLPAPGTQSDTSAQATLRGVAGPGEAAQRDHGADGILDPPMLPGYVANDDQDAPQKKSEELV